MRSIITKVLYWVFILAVSVYFANSFTTRRHKIQKLEAVNAAFEGLVEAQKEQIDALIEENERRESSNKVLLAEKLESEKQYFIISHFPFPGEPWTIEKYWVQEELWIALQSYSSRTAAEDVKAQLESKELKTRDLFR